MSTEIVPAPRPDVAVVDGVLVPATIEEAFRVATAYAQSGFLPERYKTPEAVFTAMQYASELGLKPITGLRQIAVVKGTPCIYGDLPLSLVLRSGLMEWHKEYYIDKSGNKVEETDTNLFASVFEAKRRGDIETVKRLFSYDDAQKAGLLNSPTWKSYPRLMLKYRARSTGLKDKFSDALNGMAIAEYDYNVRPDDAGNVIDAVVSSPVTELQSRFEVTEDEA